MKKAFLLMLSVLLAFALVLVTVSCESQVNDSKAAEKTEEKKDEEKGADFNEDVIKDLQIKNQVVFSNIEGLLKSIDSAFGDGGSYKDAKIDATLGLKAADGVAITTAEEIKDHDSKLSSKTPSKFKSVEIIASMKPEAAPELRFKYTTDSVTDKEWTVGSDFDTEPISYEALAVLNAVTKRSESAADDTYTTVIDFAAMIKRVLKIAKDGIDLEGAATLTRSTGEDAVIDFEVALTGSADGKTLVVDVAKLEGKLGKTNLFSVKGKVTLTLSDSFGLTHTTVSFETGAGKSEKTLKFSTGSTISAVVEGLEVTFGKCVFSGSAKGSFTFGKNSRTLTVEKLALSETIDGSKYAELDMSYTYTLSDSTSDVDVDTLLSGLTINKFAVDGTTYSPKTIKAFLKAYIEKLLAAENSEH